MIHDNWSYRVIDLPAIPEHLEQKLWDLYHMPNKEDRLINKSGYNDSVKPELTGRNDASKGLHAYRNGEYVGNSRALRYTMDQEVVDWIKANITDTWTDTGLSICKGETGSMTPHTDYTRNYALLYNIQTGHADTCFWQENGKPVHRELREFSYNYDELKLLGSTKFPPRSWVLLNTCILHSVEGIKDHRVQVQLGVNEIPKNWRFLHEETVVV